ncbi:MAG TPA: hypothetical protein VJN72_14380, partial [Gaiellales bacterium]|nr:hypothetical protein [Gaiellales bacterium]
MDPVTVSLAVAKYGPAALAAFKTFFGGKKDIDFNELQRWLSGLRAEGYLSPEDVKAAELTRSKLTQQAEETGRGLREETMTRMRQRGIDTAPAAEASLGRVSQALARARQAAGETAEEQKYATWAGNKRFEQEKLLSLVGAKIGDARTQADRSLLEREDAFTALMDYAPMLVGTGGAGTGAATTARGVSPAAS